MKMADLGKLRNIGNNLEKSIRAASNYGDKEHEAELMKARLVLLKLAQHLETSHGYSMALRNMEADIAGVLE